MQTGQGSTEQGPTACRRKGGGIPCLPLKVPVPSSHEKLSWADTHSAYLCQDRRSFPTLLQCSPSPWLPGWLPQNYSILKPEKFASQCAAPFSIRNFRRLQSKQTDTGGTASVAPMWRLPEPSLSANDEELPDSTR